MSCIFGRELWSQRSRSRGQSASIQGQMNCSVGPCAVRQMEEQEETFSKEEPGRLDDPKRKQ